MSNIVGILEEHRILTPQERHNRNFAEAILRFGKAMSKALDAMHEIALKAAGVVAEFVSNIVEWVRIPAFIDLALKQPEPVRGQMLDLFRVLQPRTTPALAQGPP